MKFSEFFVGQRIKAIGWGVGTVTTVKEHGREKIVEVKWDDHGGTVSNTSGGTLGPNLSMLQMVDPIDIMIGTVSREVV